MIQRKLTSMIILSILLLMLLPSFPSSAKALSDSELMKGLTSESVSEGVYNLAYRKTPMVSLISQDGPQTVKETAMLPRLTDGELETTGNWSNAAVRAKYAEFFRNVGRNLIIDLGQISTVKEINVRTLLDVSAGITLPYYINFSLSNDNGKNWDNVGKVNMKEAMQIGTSKTYEYRLSHLNYQAQMVKLDFEVDVHLFSDEIQVWGMAGIVDDAQIPPINRVDPYKEVNTYPAPGSEQVWGTVHDYLIYGGWHTNGTKYTPRSMDELLPAVAYIDGNGEFKDWMYDSFTFLPYQWASSGRFMLYTKNVTASTAGNKLDWQENIDFLFDGTHNIAALNQAVHEAKVKLNMPNYKAKVKITIPKAIPVQSNFGEVDGAALNFDHKQVGDQQALANRFAAIKWYIDEVLARWEAGQYENLTLDGFYWYDEAIHHEASNGEEEIIKLTSDYIHSQHKMIYWIPFYQANGFFKWKEYGFDYAIMQPNYAFTANAPKSRPTEAAKLAYRFGLGVEMEVHWNVLTDASLRQKFIDYLDQGVTQGYMNHSVLAWYWSTDTFQFVHKSTDNEIRSLYDKSYAFMKRSYPALPEGVRAFRVSDVKFTDLNDQPVSELANSGFIKVAADIRSQAFAEEEATLIVALKHRSSGVVESIAYVSRKVAPGALEQLHAGFKLPARASDYYVEVFVWNSMTGQQPLAESIVFGRKEG